MQEAHLSVVVGRELFGEIVHAGKQPSQLQTHTLQAQTLTLTLSLVMDNLKL